ncbi:MAG TPA: hypothetical protein PKC72_03460 [Chitinophagaceae bacterium]|nr:hypothetical protein [Chitinophagaceae bacterium]
MKRLFPLITLLFVITSLNAQTVSPDSTLKEYTGKYVFPEGNVVPEVTVTLESDQLSMSSTAGTSLLAKLGVDTFSIVEFSGTAIFKRNESKMIKGVYIEAAGYIMEGTRDEGNGFSFRYYKKPDEAILVAKD